MSRLGSLGIGGPAAPGGGGGGGLLGKVTGKLQETSQGDRLKPKPEPPPRVSLTGRRSPTLSGRRGSMTKEPNRKSSTPHPPLHGRLFLQVLGILEGSS